MTPPPSNSPGKFVFFTFLAALLVRTAYFLEHSGTAAFAVPMLDQLYYHLFAQAIVGGDDLRQFGGFRPMLYPAFLAMFYWIGGSAGVVISILAQHFLGAVTAALTALLAWELSGRRNFAGGVAGAICAVSAPLVFYEGELLIETLMAFLCVLQLLLIAKALNSTGRGAIGWWVAAGAVGALAVQARPNMLLFLPTYFVLPLWFAWRGKSRSSLNGLWAMAAIAVVMIVFGWVNSVQSGRFQPVTGAGGINFYLGNNARADGVIPRTALPATYTGEYRDSVEVFAESEYARAMAAEGKPTDADAGVISGYWYSRTWSEIRDAPLRWVGLMLKKTALTFANYEISNGESFAFALREESMLLRFLPGRWVVVMFLLPAGIWGVWRSGNRELLLFLLFFLGLYALSFILFFVNARFRIPLWPAAIAVAACGAEYMVRRFREGIHALVAAGGVAAIASLGFNVLVPAETLGFSYFYNSIANYEIGNYEAARRDIEESARHEEPTADVIMQMANVAFALKDYEEALGRYEEAARMEPGEPRVFNNIGATMEKMERYQDAYEAYLHALSLAPNHQTALVNAGMMELRADMIDAAEARFVRARSAPAQGNGVPLRVAEALLLAAKGNTEAASNMLDEAAEVNRAQVEELVAEYQVKITLDPVE